MTTSDLGATPDVDPYAAQLRAARWAGVVVMGLALGFALLPAIIELLSLVGSVKAFKYQNF